MKDPVADGDLGITDREEYEEETSSENSGCDAQLSDLENKLEANLLQQNFQNQPKQVLIDKMDNYEPMFYP